MNPFPQWIGTRRGHILRLVLFWIAISATLCAGSHGRAQEKAEDKSPIRLRVVLRDLTDAKGKISVLLFAGADGFPDDDKKAVAARTLTVLPPNSKTLKRDDVLLINGEVVVIFENLAPRDDYALIALHDANANGKMDTDFFGRPKEKWATSNNVRPKMRAPRFGEAKFAVLAAKATIVPDFPTKATFLEATQVLQMRR